MIRESSIGDNDRLVTLLTRDYGVLNAFAIGAKSIKSKRSSGTGLLSYSTFCIDKKGDKHTIVEATTNKVFLSAGDDIKFLCIAQYFCELCYYLGPKDTNSEEFLRLILNSLHFLTEEKHSPNLIKAITELRIAVLSGYAPNIVACDDCGKFEDDLMYFKIDNGTLYCDKCFKPENAIKINLTILKAMRHIVFSQFAKLYDFSIPDDAAKYLSDLTEKYITYQSERHYQTLDFYKQFKDL